MDKPVLDAIRELLKFKDNTTVAEIAGIAGVSRRVALEVINRNGHMVYRDRKSGKIVRIDPRGGLRERLWKSGKFYRETLHDWGSREGYEFVGNDELRAQVEKPTYGGGIGDSYPYKIIERTEENRKMMEEAGLRPWSEAVVDDSDWIEGASA